MVTQFSADPSKFAMAGYDEAGNIALRYTELTYENPSGYPVQPEAVVGMIARSICLVYGIGRKDK